MEYACSRINASDFSVAKYPMIPIDSDNTVYWHLLNLSNDLPHMDQIDIFRSVFEEWNYELWPIRFRSTSDPDKAYFKIAYVSEDGMVRYNGIEFKSPYPFDQNPQSIAVFNYNYGGKWSGWGFLNDSYFFAKMHNGDKKDLAKVLLHELGHGIQIEHTTAEGDIMLPFYSPTNIITSDTRKALHQLYGAVRSKQAALIPQFDSLRVISAEPKKKKRWWEFWK